MLNLWPFYTVLRLVVCSVLFSYIKRSKAGDCVQISPALKNRALIHHESAKSFRHIDKTPISSILFYYLGIHILFSFTTPFPSPEESFKIITHSPPRAHTYSLFNKFKILNIFNVYKYQVSCFVFLHMQKLLPSPLSSLFVLKSDCRQYLTAGNKITYIFIILTNILFLFGYRDLKIGMTFLSHFLIHLLFSSYKHKLRHYFQSF